jgi:hypothetical protein
MSVNIESDPHVEQFMVGSPLAFLKLTQWKRREPIG